MRLRRRPLTIPEILCWADAYREATGKWPTVHSGGIAGTIGDSWKQVGHALREGLRSLPGGSSLARLLAEHRGKRNLKGLPALSEEKILAWADEHRQSTGSWPTADSGPIITANGEKWGAVDSALHAGLRGLNAGSSLARLLAEKRGVRNRKDLPPLTEDQILKWADAHHHRTGSWPSKTLGPVLDAPGETWIGVGVALQLGRRGFPGGSSLAWLLAEKRGVRNLYNRPVFSVEQILSWADTFHERTGKWPNLSSGLISESPGDTWAVIDKALRRGSRGLPGGSSLAKLLADRRGARNKTSIPRLSRERILSWADAHFRRTGAWPMADSGPIVGVTGETWVGVDGALKAGSRGLRGGSSLAKLLARRRGRRHLFDQPPLSIKKILAWADACHQRTGEWPKCKSGVIPEAPGETWAAVDGALREGRRGQTGGSSLTRLLARKRGIRNPAKLPPLNVDLILSWADAHQRCTGRWPNADSGPVSATSGDTWGGIDWTLAKGARGLTSGSSLAKLLAENRGIRNKKSLARLTPEQILAWVNLHQQRTGRRPTKNSGPIQDASGETWRGVDAALRHGLRGLAGTSSLAKLLTAQGQTASVSVAQTLAHQPGSLTGPCP
jgi:hypothetical protein